MSFGKDPVTVVRQGMIAILLALAAVACIAKEKTQIVEGIGVAPAAASYSPNTASMPGGDDHAKSSHPPAPADTPATPSAIVIGFVGGFIKHDDPVHGGVLFAERLRKDFSSDVHVQVFENHRREEARQQLLRLLDTNHDGTLTAEEKRGARVIIYGVSWGASEAVTLSRELEQDGIPVLLTIHVDSVTKIGQNDEVIPANVARAANFYQSDGFLHGRPEIRAADPARTQIIGNFHFDYKTNPIDCSQYPWFARAFEKPHIEIESDPRVWNQVDALIRSTLLVNTN
jgi:hypothetical protein